MAFRKNMLRISALALGFGTPVTVAAQTRLLPAGEGTWEVTVRLGSETDAAVTTIKAQNRRLVVLSRATAKGEQAEEKFIVHLRNDRLPKPPANAPGSAAVRLTAAQRTEHNWHDALTLEFLGSPAVREVSLRRVDVPVVYLAGDSMVADQPAEPAASWGQMLTAMLDDRIAVANFAQSGATLKSFLAELRLDKILSMARGGDWLLIQFGHNDQKAQWPQTFVAADCTYPAYLRTYIAEAQARGMKPVLVTSPERRNFDSRDHVVPSLGDYPQAMRRVGRELGVPVLDLNRASIALYESLGREEATTLFNDNGADRTHYNNAGAWLAARMVADAIRDEVPELAQHLTVPRLQGYIAPPIAASNEVVSQRPAGD